MSDASRAMSIAGEYRSQGYSPSEALSMAWDEVRGEHNPIGEGTSMAVILVAIAGVGLILHRAITGKWLWQGIARRQLAMPRRPMLPAGSARQPVSRYTTGTTPMGTRGPDGLVGMGYEVLVPARTPAEETISIITP